MKTSNFILKVLKYFFYFTFIGLALCVLISFMLSVFSILHYDGGAMAKNIKISLPFFKGTFAELQGATKAGFSVLLLLLSVYFALVANLVFKVIQIIKKINLEQPFSLAILSLIRSVSKLSLWAGLLSFFIIIAGSFLANDKGIDVEIDWNQFDFIFFAAIIYVISIIYQKGVELQSENDLTI